MKVWDLVKSAYQQVKFNAESYWFGIASDDMQTFKTANYTQVAELLSRYPGEQSEILITRGLPEYKGRSALVYAASLLSNEVKGILRTDVPKAIDVLTVPTSNHTVSDVIRTFIQIYEHCKREAGDVLAEHFEPSVVKMIEYKMAREWRGDKNPGLEEIVKFITDLAYSYTKIEDKYHFDITGYSIALAPGNHYIISQNTDDTHAIFDIGYDGEVQMPLEVPLVG